MTTPRTNRNVIAAIIPTTRFSFSKRVFVAERSDLSRCQPFSQIYKDAADRGFIMENPKTGNQVLFCVSGIDKDCDGEVVGWRFRAVSTDPIISGLSVLIIND